MRAVLIHQRDAVLTLNNSTVANNAASSDAHVGGGIDNFFGAVTLNNSAVSGNSAGSGGGIFNTGALTLNNSTESGNAATYPWGGQGGGIFQGYSGSTATINNSTIAYNTVLTSTGATGGIHIDFYAVLSLTNSIVANNGVNGNFAVSGTLTSQGYNLSDNWNGLSLQASDRTGDPLLAPLANNGGATWTHALLPGSPAIDAGNNATCMSTDQRGIDRPQGPACDMGAYEWLGFTLSIAAAGNGSGVVTPTVGAHSYWPGAVVALQATRLRRVLTTDPGTGIMRHADAGYPEAIAAARERGVKIPGLPT